jgi:hypothetical protein
MQTPRLCHIVYKRNSLRCSASQRVTEHFRFPLPHETFASLQVKEKKLNQNYQGTIKISRHQAYVILIELISDGLTSFTPVILQ